MLIFKYFQNFLNFKFYLDFPRKKKILIFDDVEMDEVKDTIDKYGYIELNLREKFNIFILLKIIFKLKKINIHEYTLEFIKSYSPKLIISVVEHNISFYQLKEKFPTIIFIMVQNGMRSKNFDIFDSLKKENKKLFVDHFFLFDELIAKEYKKYINFKTHVVGSFKNNCVRINNRIKYKKSLLFISQSPNKPFVYKKKLITEKNYKNFWIEENLLNIIRKYCIKNQITLYILGKNRDKNFRAGEIFFYIDLLGKDFKFLKARKRNYSLVDKYDTIITINSTLGYESLARKKKCIFLNNRKIYGKKISTNLWPLKLNNHGQFYSDNINQKSVYDLLSKNINLNYKEWYKINKKIASKFQNFDYQNKKFKSLINYYMEKDKNVK